MENDFQISFASNKDACWEVVKLFHPTINDIKKEKLKVSFKYDWVMLNVGRTASIGVEFDCKLSGSDWDIKAFEKEINDNSFKAWRFADDSRFEDDVDEENTKLLNAIFLKHGVKKPTAKQMHNYYYRN